MDYPEEVNANRGTRMSLESVSSDRPDEPDPKEEGMHYLPFVIHYFLPQVIIFYCFTNFHFLQIYHFLLVTWGHGEVREECNLRFVGKNNNC